MKHIRLFAAAAGASLALAAPASADPLQFVITGDYSASFILDSNPSPDVVLLGGYFTIWDVPGFPDAIFDVTDITFFNAAFDGGMQIEDFYFGSLLLVTDGPQLYSGSEDSPTFLTGTYALSEYLGTGSYTLTISSVSGAVPEPASWAMMIGGFGLAGAALRRRGYKKGKVSVAYAA
jgi:PEP-CTERM motif